MRRLPLLTIILAATMSMACLGADEKENWELIEEQNQNNQNNQNNNNNVEVDPNVDVTGMFVSGHLGNYSGCEDEGYAPDAGARSGAPEPSGEEGGLWAGDCAEDSPNCGISMCEPAQLTIKLDNLGTAEALGMTVSKLSIYNSDGEFLADLPLESVVDAESGEAAPEALQAEESRTLRVQFQGPAHPYEFLEDESGAFRNSGTMQITVEFENHEAVIIKTGALYSIDNVAT